MQPPTILGLDPGTRNFAYALREDGLITRSGWLPPMVSVGNDAEFTNAYIELLAKTHPDYIVIERFMVRNAGQSVHAEAINQMIGRIAILSRWFDGCDPIQITAAQWKNRFNKRGFDWLAHYSDLESVHQRDAAAMAQYLEEKLCT